MKKLTLIGCGLVVMMFNTSCVSYMALKSNKEKAYKSEIAKRGNPPEMVKAFAHGDIVGIGFEVTAMDAIFYDFGTFIKQTGAAVADAAILYGSYEAISSLNDSDDGSSSKSQRSESGRDSSSVIIEGDGNSVQIRGDETVYGAPIAGPVGE